MLEGDIAQLSQALKKCEQDLTTAVAQERAATANVQAAKAAAHGFELKSQALQNDVARLDAERLEVRATMETALQSAKRSEDTLAQLQSKHTWELRGSKPMLQI